MSRRFKGGCMCKSEIALVAVIAGDAGQQIDYGRKLFLKRGKKLCVFLLGKGENIFIFRHLRHALKLSESKTEVGLKLEKRLRRGVVSDGYIGNGHAEGIFAYGGGAGYA